MPQKLQDAVAGPQPQPRQDSGPVLPPASEGGAVQSEVVTVPPNVSQDMIGTIPYGGEFMQQPTQSGIPMLGSPMVYNRVAEIARTLAGRGGIGGVATGIGVGALGSSLFDSNGRPATVPQMVRSVTGQPFTRKTQMAYKNLAEMTGLQNAAACLGIPEQLFCQAMIHRFPVRRRGISAAQLRTAKRVNRTVKQMHAELGLKTTTRRAPARRAGSTVIQNS